MADDTRSRARKTHRPIFIVANPGSGEDDDADPAYAPRAQKHPYNPHPSPTHTSPPPDRATHPPASSSSSSYREPGPLTTTNLPSHSRHHPASRSNPTLSSPSGTSSPPPSTPGQSAPPGDLVADAAARHDFAPSYSTDALHQQHSSHSISAKSTFLDKMKANIHHPFAHARRLSSSSRPTTSPTTSTSDTYATRFPNDSRSSPLDKVLIFVTGDSDQYYTVDITGFRHGAFIKELVFSKLRISDEEQAQYSIYRTKVGAYALGDALTDDQLFELCRDEGDADCSLKFLVASSSAVVHENAPSSPVTSPTVSTVPPPVLLPYNSNRSYSPQQRRRSQSRHGSISSASERLPIEPANGYDPSVSDDFDGVEESQRTTLRPPPKQAMPSLPSQNNTIPPSPVARRPPTGPMRPSSPPQMSTLSPLPPLSPDRARGPTVDYSPRRADRGRPENSPQTSLTLPPSMSPDRSRTPYDEDASGSQLTSWAHHARSGSDAAAERERILEASESRSEVAGRQWQQQQQQQHQQQQGQRSDRPERPKRRVPGARDTSRLGREPSSMDRSSPLQESRGGLRRERGYRSSPRHPQDATAYFNGTPLPHVPRQPPPVPPGGPPESRGSGRPVAQAVRVPKDWPVTWKGPGRTDHAQAPSMHYNLKGAKSVDSMRDRFNIPNISNIPATLMPGAGRRTQPPLPSLPMVPSSSMRDALAPSHSAGYVSGDTAFSARREPIHMTASPESARPFVIPQPGAYASPTSHRPVRPLPAQQTGGSGGSGGNGQMNAEPSAGPTYGPSLPRSQLSSSSSIPASNSSNAGSAGLLSPQQDHYPRPRSALGDESAPPPYRPQRTVDASVFAEPLQEPDFVRQPPPPPPPPPPSHASQIPMYPFFGQMPPSYSGRAPTGDAGERPQDLHHHRPGDNSNRTPPRSPASPRSPRAEIPTRERFGPRPDPSSTATSSSWNAELRSPDATVLGGERKYFQQMLDGQSNGGDTATLRPKQVLPVIPPPPPLNPPSYRPPIPPPPPLQPLAPQRAVTPPPIPTTVLSTPSTPDSHSTDGGDEWDSESGTLWQTPMVEDDSGTLWQTPMPDRPRSSGRGPPLTVKIDSKSSSPGSLTTKGSNGYTTAIPADFPPPPKNPPPEPPAPAWGARSKGSGGAGGSGKKGARGDVGGAFQDQSWASRPNPEDVYDRLEKFFPGHDLDKPVIEASSGGTSPTATEHSSAAPQQPHLQNKHFKHKKSIRVVAEEHKQRIDRSSRMQQSTSMLRKRSTKLWGSKVEEVMPGQLKAGLTPSTPESPLTAGAVAPKPIFKWVRGELIGKGNFGRVYLALNATTGEMIAVKQVEIPRTASDKSDSRQVTVVEALKLESETLKDLDHPNIVQYLGFEETPTFLSIFLEYVPGGSVGSCLRKYGRFDEDVTKSFSAQILSGLEYLHSKNILHRDLKADNILVEQTGVCKISDFGISKRTDDVNEQAVLTAMQGTVFWMAPEVVNTGKRGYNAKVDIWSVGCVVLEMWAGERPWRKEEAMAVIVKLYHQKQAPPIPSGITLSELADDFRRKCFAVNPDERPSAAELRKHRYLVVPPEWTFKGFSLKDTLKEDASY